MYCLRKRVPDDLRLLVGKREEKRSLKTKDVAEAKSRQVAALAEVETRWSSLRRGLIFLTQADAYQLARSV